MELIKSFLASQGLVYAAGSIGAIVIAWILKKIPNNKIKLVFGRLMYGLGVALTLGLSKWKLTSTLWNKVIEPWFIDIIDNVIGHGINEFIRGLRSDTLQDG